VTDHTFAGAFTALVTPFNAAGEVDEKGFGDFIEWQISEGTQGLVPVGTTGESPTLTHAEHKRAVEIAVEVSRGRVPVMAGAGSNNTAAAIEFAKHAQKVGADAVLVVTPYYNKPNQNGLHGHFTAVAQATDLPLFIYNIPSRSIVDMTPETMGRLAREQKTIVGVKDATGLMERLSEQRAVCGNGFIQLSGNDDSSLGYLGQGGHGCISVSGNVAPRLVADFQKAWAAGETAKALELNDRLFPLHRALFVEPNPAGAKYALSLLGRMGSDLRLPLVPLEEATKERVREAMMHAGLLN
jgi:4-hydroxy-tetrahydrodipicolinate synthase